MSKVTLPYGKTSLSTEIPDRNLMLVGWPKEPSMIPLIDDEIQGALDNPIGGPRIADIAGPGKRIVIISDDYTRPTPTRSILPALLARLSQAGVAKSDVTILVAGGIHRKMSEEDLIAKLGKEVVEQFRIVLHDVDDKEKMVCLGRTSRGTPVWIDKEVVQADVKISIGTVEAHPYAGFCGGAKIYAVASAGRESIYYNHGQLAASPDSWFGRTEGNPCWEDMVEFARMVKPDLGINVVLSAKKEVVRAFAGDIVACQKAAIEVFLQVYGVPLKRPADIVLASANPKQFYFDLANLAMMNAGTIVKKGGTRVIAAYCEEALGPALHRRLYTESFGRPWPRSAEYLKEMQGGKYAYQMADAPAIYKLFQAEEKSEMILVTEALPEEDANRMRLNWTRSLDEAMRQAFAKQGADAQVAVLPLAGMCYPYLAN
ncbi:MAG: nickel-dependent lactate racemase [Chloroflexi bacterium]|nr:nickel-dependent lactate racemase [Chloroflexota bacterium]